MKNFLTWLKSNLPVSIKNFLRPFYHRVLKWRYINNPKTYQQQKQDEIARFDLEEEVNDLPEIFHYWSNKYLVPKLERHGFKNPDEFFLKYAIKAIEKTQGTTTILSIGAGNCDSEVILAKNLRSMGHQCFIIECMDINEIMFERGKKLATLHGVEQHLQFLNADFNQWKAQKKYPLIIANQSLHHVVELEHLYDNILMGLNDHGRFITSDVIGRNGHKRWPEALSLLKPIWKSMPKRYKFNHSFNRLERNYINHDCSTQGFEGIRAQDVLPLMLERFDFEIFVPFANLIMVFIDRPFGPNFDVSNPEDLDFIDYIHELDEKHMSHGNIKPTQMLAAVCKPDCSDVL